MTGGMAKYWIIPCGGQGTASCRSLTGFLQSPHFLCSKIYQVENMLSDENLQNELKAEISNFIVLIFM